MGDDHMKIVGHFATSYKLQTVRSKFSAHSSKFESARWHNKQNVTIVYMYDVDIDVNLFYWQIE